MRLVSIYDSILRPAYTDQQFAAYKDFRKAVIKYGTFMAQVAQAENSDDVKTAIESVALPTGSASIKNTRVSTSPSMLTLAPLWQPETC